MMRGKGGVHNSSRLIFPQTAYTYIILPYIQPSIQKTMRSEWSCCFGSYHKNVYIDEVKKRERRVTNEGTSFVYSKVDQIKKARA